MISYDEKKALADIAALSRDAKMHLQHVTGNQLQSISGMVEEGDRDGAQTAIQVFAAQLRGLTR